VHPSNFVRSHAPSDDFVRCHRCRISSHLTTLCFINSFFVSPILCKTASAIIIPLIPVLYRTLLSRRHSFKGRDVQSVPFLAFGGVHFSAFAGYKSIWRLQPVLKRLQRPQGSKVYKEHHLFIHVSATSDKTREVTLLYLKVYKEHHLFIYVSATSDKGSDIVPLNCSLKFYRKNCSPHSMPSSRFKSCFLKSQRKTLDTHGQIALDQNGDLF
jgi:hypothetical protein